VLQAQSVSVSPTRALLVDYGGVISLPQPAEPVAEMAALAGLDVPRFVERYWEHRPAYDRGIDARPYWTAVLGTDAIDARILDQLERLDMVSWSELNVDTLEILIRAHASGVGLSLLSNAPHALADALDDHPAMAIFDHLMFSARLGAVKPEPAAFAAALETMALEPDEIVFIDDRPDNVEGAIACGLGGIVFRTAEQLQTELCER
jgi:putative hydrolase of the HAD superfamily